MTSGNETSKQAAGRHPFGPRPLGTLMPAVTRAAFRKHSPAAAQLLADWEVVVGHGLAATTMPRRLAAGTLTIACAGPVALELQHLAVQLLDRINRYLGRPAVARLRFVQDASLAAETPPPARPRLEPIEIAGLPNGPLREALSALGAAVRSDPA